MIINQNNEVVSYQTPEGYVSVSNNGGIIADYFYNVSDWLGTNRAIMDATGTVVNAHDHYPFGKRMPARHMVTDAEGNRYQFTGHEFDEETGFDYHGARYYNRELGRYMNVDPINKHHESSYVYAANNPVIFIDVNGEDTLLYKKDVEIVKTDADGNKLEDPRDWYVKPTKRISSAGNDKYFYQHKEGTHEINGKKYIQLWDPAALKGHDYDMEGTDGVLINGFGKWAKGELKKFGAPDIDIFDVIQGTTANGKITYRGKSRNSTGELDIAYNGKLDNLTIKHGGTLSKNSFSNSLFNIGGLYANANMAGNYYIGRAAGYSNFGSQILLYGHAYSLIQLEGFDEPHEQLMVALGMAATHLMLEIADKNNSK